MDTEISGAGDDKTTVDPLLSIENLRVDLNTARGPIRVVSDFSLELEASERVALVGESGSGKTIAAQSLVGLVPDATVGGSVRLAGQEILNAPKSHLRRIRGAEIGFIFQNPLSALDPRVRIENQVLEALRIHGIVGSPAKARVAETLEELGLRPTPLLLRSYPHQLSGGMRQRVVAAIALATNPKVIIADEPTTALDVRVQAQVLQTLDSVTSRRGTTVLLITHDLAIVNGFADRIAVMYSGSIVEEGTVTEVLDEPCHPYTRGLLSAIPRIDATTASLVPIPGVPPTPSARPRGCPFHPRCSVKVDDCMKIKPPLRIISRERAAACHLVDVSEHPVKRLSNADVS